MATNSLGLGKQWNSSMATRPKRAQWRLLSRWAFFTVVAAMLVPSLPTWAKIRTSIVYSNFVNPEATVAIASVFNRGGVYTIAGGVVLHGQAEFYLENGTNKTKVSPTELSLTINPEGVVSLAHKNRRYKLETHRGLACPLGTFVAREGLIAFTIPREPDDERMARAGLVDGTIAKEFDDTIFEPLLDAADFAKAVPVLPTDFAERIVSNINEAVGAGVVVPKLGSYVNSDQQVTYQVYLMVKERTVDISGVPLRYYWAYTSNGAAKVLKVSAFSQEWPPNQTLTNLSKSDHVTQYDIVSLYQTAGVYRQLYATNKESFTQFVSTACAQKSVDPPR